MAYSYKVLQNNRVMNNQTLLKAKKHLSEDKTLKPIIENYDFKINGLSENVYDALIKAIVYQQLSGKVANLIYNRFLELFDDRNPKVEIVVTYTDEKMREAGISRQKAGYIRNIAHYFLENNMQQTDWESLSDDEIIKMLTTIKGVGEWTVQMLLMFNLGRPDVLPINDLGIQLAMKDLYNLSEDKRTLKKQIKEIAENWRPYRTFACLLLWHWKDGGAF